MGIKGWTIGKTRGALYKSGRVLGDVNAVSRGTVPQRIASRLLGGVFASLLGSIIRAIFGRR